MFRYLQTTSFRYDIQHHQYCNYNDSYHRKIPIHEKAFRQNLFHPSYHSVFKYPPPFPTTHHHGVSKPNHNDAIRPYHSNRSFPYLQRNKRRWRRSRGRRKHKNKNCSRFISDSFFHINHGGVHKNYSSDTRTINWKKGFRYVSQNAHLHR